jgi:DNA-binding transcriptional ArsR family regulator
VRKSALQAVPVPGEICASCAEVVAGPGKRPKKRPAIDFTRFADMLSAMGAEPRLRIMHVLLTAHPKGMVVGDIQAELDIAPSTLSHHLDKLRHEGLVTVRRDRKYLWYAVDTSGLQELLGFLLSECCSRNRPVNRDAIFKLCG